MPKLVKPSAVIVAETPNMLDVIEDAARICYLSEPKTVLPVNPYPIHLEARRQEQEKFLREKIKLGHHSILEHAFITVDFICDRGVTHEMVRHRIAAYSQESTRYCNYSKDKYDNQISVITPIFYDENDAPELVTLPTHLFPGHECIPQFDAYLNKFDVWFFGMQMSEWCYLQLLIMGSTAQEARSVLANSLKTKIRTTFDVREWRHFFTLRCAGPAHPQMREITIPLLHKFQKKWPILFDDLVF